MASFIGSPAMNLLRGLLDGSALMLGPYSVPLSDEVTSRLTGRAEEVIVGLRPEDIGLAAASTGEPLSAAVTVTEQLGPETLAFVQIAGIEVVEDAADRPAGLAATLAVRLDGASDVRPETTIDLALRTERIQLFDPETGASLLRPPAQ